MRPLQPCCLPTRDVAGYVTTRGPVRGRRSAIRWSILLAVFVAVCVQLPDAAQGVAWRTDINGTLSTASDQAYAVAVDPFGTVVVAGRTQNETDDFTVAMFDKLKGSELWRYERRGLARAVAFDSAGDVFAVGYFENASGDADFAVVKLDGGNGEERWRRLVSGTLSGALDEALALSVDSAGDLVAAGSIQNAGSGIDFTVVKLDGATGAERWRRVSTGTQAGGADVASAVAVNSAGDVVAAGHTQNTGSGTDFTVVQLDGTSGAESWRRLVTGTQAGGSDVARAVAVNSVDEVVAAGHTQNTGSIGNFTAVKLDGADGTERWRRVVTGTQAGGTPDVARSVAVDTADDVIAAGSVHNAGTGDDFAVVKLDGTDGAERWRRLVAGTQAGGTDVARGVVIDGMDEVIAAGSTENTGSGVDVTAVKLNGATGTERWRRDITGTQAGGTDFAQGVTVDNGGYVVAAGSTHNVRSGADFTVLKLEGASGTNFWQQAINGRNARAHDFGRAAVVDSFGDSIVAGYMENDGTSFDFAVVKLEGFSGTEVWRYSLTGTMPAVLEQATSVFVDGAGDVIAAGYLENTGSGQDFTIVKLDGASGAERWRRVLTGTEVGGSDVAQTVKVDSAGNVIAAGYLDNAGSGLDFTVVKLDGASGAEQWRGVVIGTLLGGNDVGTALAVDSGDDVVAAGYIENAGTRFDFTVVYLDGASGGERWRAGVTGTLAGGTDTATAVAVDASGNVVAAGSTQNADSGDDFTVVKLDGASGTERWRNVVAGAFTSGSDFAYGVAVDSVGDAVAVGSTQNAGSGADFTVVKVNGADGAERWRRLVTGTQAGGQNVAASVAIDAADDVIAGGSTQNTGGGDDFTVVKLDGVAGAERWRGLVAGTRAGGTDVAYVVGVDGAGDVIAAGVTGNVATGQDVTVVKFSGANGAQF